MVKCIDCKNAVRVEHEDGYTTYDFMCKFNLKNGEAMLLNFMKEHDDDCGFKPK